MDDVDKMVAVIERISRHEEPIVLAKMLATLSRLDLKFKREMSYIFDYTISHAPKRIEEAKSNEGLLNTLDSYVLSLSESTV